MRLTLLLLLPLLALPAQAQHRHGHHAAPAPVADPARPYAGLQDRRIRALSATEIDDLLAGRGMALALAAELNGYPGPMHVLEHAAALRLSPAQRARAEALRAAMLEEARPLGARIVALEEQLDALFARGEADAARLAALTSALGEASGRLRRAHLEAHIGMREALSAEQRQAYAQLRGYVPR